PDGGGCVIFCRAIANPSSNDLLQLFAAEADLPPYHFPLGEIGRRGQMDPPKRDR
ncbi:MAG: hypothetical protein HC857_05570, partial [Synechococcales cyanobacterium RU_4_20]|nr:hypothetical protein [Synechococcales cyanobacterium RU_4_20]